MKLEFLALAILMVGFTSAISICVDLDAPSAPQNLAISGSSGNLLLTWDEAIDEPNCSGIAYYNISRDNVWIGTTNASTLSFKDTDSLGEGTYAYTVYAIDMVGHNAGNSIKNTITIHKGGGSSGGNPSSSDVCNVNWSCGNWTDCINGQEWRICVDENECGTTHDKPETIQNCTIDSTEISSTEIEPIEDEESNFNLASITGAAVGAITSPVGLGLLILIIALLILYFIVKNKNNKKPSKK